MKEKNKNNSAINTIAIGFLLIFLVIFLFFLKSGFENKKNKENFAKTEEAREEKDYVAISKKDLFEKTKFKKKDFFLLDIRSKEEFQEEHIIDSINLSFSEIEKNLTIFEKDKEYFLIDSLGLTPNQKHTLDFFKRNNFEKVFFLEGGFLGWKNELYPTISFGNPHSLNDQSKVIYISSQDLNEILKNEKNVFLLDVRSKGEYLTGKIKEAVNIPLENLEKERDKIPPFKKIILYDNEGMEAFQGAVRLFDLGIFNVYTLSDGLKTWREKGFEIVR